MSKTLRYVDEFIFPSSAGFSGSSTGRDDARDQPLTPEQQGLEFGLKGNFDGGDDGTYVAKLARGGQPRKKLASGGGDFSRLRHDEGDWTDNLDRIRPATNSPDTDPKMERQPRGPQARTPNIDTGDVYQGKDRGDRDQELARGGQPKRIAAPRRMKLPQAPGPSPTPAMSPMAQALATPGSPMNAPGSATSMAGQPPVQPDGMAHGGRMRKAKGGRACYDGGGGVDSFDSSRDRPMTTSYSDAPASRAVDPAYTEESPRGRFPAGAPKKPVQRAAARPLPRPPAYEPPPRTGTVSVDVRARPAAAERSFRPGDAYTDPMLPTTTSYAKGGHFIQGAIKHPGALHRELGVPQGEKIPAAKLKAAAHSENPTLRHRAQFAETLKGLSHKRG